MNKPVLIIAALFVIISINSCSKRTHPTAGDTVSAARPAETATVKKATVKTAVPKVIMVNDSVAKRSVDGRYYYDLGGRRYWRNNRDGKYYLFNKSMYDNPDFKAPPKQ